MPLLSPLNSTTYINDGVWHRLEAHFKPTYMELSVDDRIEDQPTHVGENKFFDLSGYLFVGGVEVNKQARAVSQGARNGDKRYGLLSFKTAVVY